ncbi:MAG: cytochrome c biogenesis protein CcsA [Oligoflexia bacterium]|nr:cytochrome c biogenesis protein CcsA [Oligoflexia bacterium]
MKLFLASLCLLITSQTLAQNPHQVNSTNFKFDVSEIERTPIQDGGRIKPIDTFARESVMLITGSAKFQSKRPAELVLSWLFLPDLWADQSFFQIKHLELKKALELPTERQFFSPKELTQNPKLGPLFNQLNELTKDKKKLDTFFTAVNRLSNQMYFYQEIISGRAFKLYPQALSPDWLSIADAKGESREAFNKIAEGYVSSITKEDSKYFSEAVQNFRNFAKTQGAHYPTAGLLTLEILFNRMHPFAWASVLCLIAALGFGFRIVAPHRKFWSQIAWAAWIGSAAIQVFGFALRSVLAGRPPVSNMYESVIWVALGTTVFGIILEAKYKKHYVGLASAVMATLALLVTDLAPAVLDRSIRPLEPVLKSNLWLTIHVLPITLSYAAFTLASGLGNIALWSYITGQSQKHKERLQALALYSYKSIQIGVLLITAGTILGGVWADYSWGRFWGWDPKETWALIADLTYLAVLHGRFTGWIKVFGLHAASVLCYASVIMAWYGVNFVLGQGLHSYGFGAGGVGYVAAILGIQVLYVIIAGLRYRSESK